MRMGSRIFARWLLTAIVLTGVAWIAFHLR